MMTRYDLGHVQSAVLLTIDDFPVPTYHMQDIVFVDGNNVHNIAFMAGPSAVQGNTVSETLYYAVMHQVLGLQLPPLHALRNNHCFLLGRACLAEPVVIVGGFLLLVGQCAWPSKHQCVIQKKPHTYGK